MRGDGVRELSNALCAVFWANRAGYTDTTLEAVSRDSGVSLFTVRTLAEGKRRNRLGKDDEMRLWAAIDEAHASIGGYR